MDNRSRSMKHAEKNLSEPAWLQIVKKQASSLRYGVVVVTVHNGVVVQIERTEKTRIEPPRSEPSGTYSVEINRREAEAPNRGAGGEVVKNAL